MQVLSAFFLNVVTEYHSKSEPLLFGESDEAGVPKYALKWYQRGIYRMVNVR